MAYDPIWPRPKDRSAPSWYPKKKKRRGSLIKVRYQCRACAVLSSTARRYPRSYGSPLRPWRGLLWLQGWTYSSQPQGWYCPSCSVTLDASRATVALSGSRSHRGGPMFRHKDWWYHALHAVARVHLAVRRVLRR